MHEVYEQSRVDDDKVEDLLVSSRTSQRQSHLSLDPILDPMLVVSPVHVFSMCLVSNHAARFIQLQRCVRRGITKASAACVRVLRAEKQPHGQVQEQVHVQVQGSAQQGSAQQQQCAMCKSNAVAVSKVLAAVRSW